MERTEEIVANKQLRKEIDEKIQQVKVLPASRERSLAITKLQEAECAAGLQDGGQRCLPEDDIETKACSNSLG